MQITVKTTQHKVHKVLFSPASSMCFSYPDQIDIEPADTVLTLKTKIEAAHGYPVSTQKVIYSGKWYPISHIVLTFSRKNPP